MTKIYEIPDGKTIIADVDEKHHTATVSVYALNDLVEAVNKTGHWIEKDGFDGDTYYDCSECGESWITIEGTPWDNEFKYCPNCGAKMVEPQETETWNGYHGQITAPKGTFEKIYEDAESEDKE